MNCYAGMRFEQSPLNPGSYLMKDSFGDFNLKIFPIYKPTKRNVDAKIDGQKYILFSIPKKDTIKRYFARIFELGNGLTLSGTDELQKIGNVYRTFGDTKKLRSNDLILFEFSEDMKELKMYFIRNMGWTREQKEGVFCRWNNGEKLTREVA